MLASPLSSLKPNSTSCKKQNKGCNKYTARTKNKLEKELFEPASSDDEFDFSFLPKKCLNVTVSECDDIEGADSKAADNLNDSMSLFVIDRTSMATGQTETQNISGDNSVKSTEDDGSQEKSENKARIKKKDITSLLKWARMQPTSLQVIEAPSMFNEDLSKESCKLSAKIKEPEIMKKSIIADNFEQKHAIPAYSESKKALAKKRREERAKTKGSGWFDMKAPEMTEELEADIEALQMRGSAASWTGYKKNDYKAPPKYFQVATVEDSPLDFYHSRIPKKDRKRTLVDELLADAEFRKNNKKMFVKAMDQLKYKQPKKKMKRK